ncbi:hypothetical protein WA026_007713 [Henosepilachna vigintioctopunctata]|uniref:Large ribosomal subunit protein uL6 N-terminal domain-containing protein n=1 Tax=Henosepilachna vigintioctopunctata TaxID=420089 RepID=A0AAW1TYI0_9CUCU
MAPTSEIKESETKKVIKQGKPRNYDLGNGVVRSSRSKMYHKKAFFKLDLSRQFEEFIFALLHSSAKMINLSSLYDLIYSSEDIFVRHSVRSLHLEDSAISTVSSYSEKLKNPDDQEDNN